MASEQKKDAAKPAAAKKVVAKKGQPVRLYTKAVHVGYQRSKRNQNPNKSLLKIQGVKDKDAAKFYLGKRVAFVYRAQRAVAGRKQRVIWGKITRTHGNTGGVRAKFSPNLPAKTLGASLRVMMYPSSI